MSDSDPLAMLERVHRHLKDRKIYQKVLDRILRNMPYHVLVMGASGTGKTSLIRYLRGLDPFVRREDRTDSVKSFDGKIDDSFFRFVDTPGEDLHEAKRIIAIKEAAGSYPLGIINVVSYGYHEGPASPGVAIESETPSGAFLDAPACLSFS